LIGVYLGCCGQRVGTTASGFEFKIGRLGMRVRGGRGQRAEGRGQRVVDVSGVVRVPGGGEQGRLNTNKWCLWLMPTK